MDKKTIYSVLIGVLFLVITMYGALAIPQADIWYKMDNNESNASIILDSMNNYTISTTGMTYSTTNKKVGESSLTSTPTQKTIMTSGTGDYSICGWFNVTDKTTTAHFLLGAGGYIGASMSYAGASCSSGNFCYYTYFGSSYKTTQYAVNNSQWYHFCGITQSGRNLLYVDNNLVANISGGIGSDVASYMFFSPSEPIVDDFYVKKGYALSALEVEELYNRSVSAPPSSNFTVSAFDIYNNVSVSNFTAEIDGQNYTTTTGTASTSLLSNDTSNYTLKIWSPQDLQGALFNSSFTVSPSASSYNAYLLQSDVRSLSFQMFLNDSTPQSVYINGSGVTYPVYLSSGSYNFTAIENTSGGKTYFQKEKIYTVPPLYNGTVNVENVSSGRLNITVKNGYTGNLLSNFTGWVYHNSTGGNNTFNSSGAGYVIMDLIEGEFYVFAYADGYTQDDSNYKEVNITAPLNHTQFSLYSANSLLVYIRDEVTGNLITQNVTLTLTGDTEYINYTTTGSIFYENLTDGNYTLKLQADNYTLRTYTVTVADLSTQTLTAYLTSETSEVVMTVLDFQSSAVIPDASITMSKLINSTWTTIESKTTDITGRAQLTYITGVKYRFDVSADGYESKTFYLDPVLFDAYNIRLSKSVTLEDDSDYIGVSVSYNPTYFYTEYQNNFTISFYSGGGTLENYNYTLSYPSGSVSGNGSNAIGENFLSMFNITGASFGDTANLTYCYKSTIGTEDRCFSFQYYIIDAYSQTSWLAIKDNTYGLGIFERIIIAVVLTLVVSGLIGLVAGGIGAGIMAIFLLGFFVAIGFIPIWSILVSVILGFFLLVRRTE